MSSKWEIKGHSGDNFELWKVEEEAILMSGWWIKHEVLLSDVSEIKS
jgi:hypothetical protein